MVFNESIVRVINTKDKPFFLSRNKPTGKEYRSKEKVIMPSLTITLFPHLYHFDPFCTPQLTGRLLNVLCMFNLHPVSTGTVEYPWIKSWFVGKVASNFVSLIIRISILPPMIDESNSNLFLVKFILKCPIILLLEYLTRRIFNPKIISSWCSSRTEFIELVSDSGLRLS